MIWMMTQSQKHRNNLRVLKCVKVLWNNYIKATTEGNDNYFAKIIGIFWPRKISNKDIIKNIVGEIKQRRVTMARACDENGTK